MGLQQPVDVAYLSRGSGVARLLNRLDTLPPLNFVLTLYFVRWLFLIPLMLLDFFFRFLQPVDGGGSPGALIITALFISPVLETLLECSLPHVVMYRLRRAAPAPRPWIFIIVSAVVMALLHPYFGAIIPCLITGAFLAYTYARFASISHVQAILWTSAFHMAINMVGVILLIASMM